MLSRAASYNMDSVADLKEPSTANHAQDMHAQVYERNPTTPTTPTFVLSTPSFFGGGKSAEPMLLGGWSRSKNSQTKGAKQRPSLVRPSALLSDNAKTDVSSLASHGDSKLEHEKGSIAYATSSDSASSWTSLQHMLYTRKGRRGAAMNLRASISVKSIFALVILIFFSFRLVTTPSAPLQRDVNGRLVHKHKAAKPSSSTTGSTTSFTIPSVPVTSPASPRWV